MARRRRDFFCPLLLCSLDLCIFVFDYIFLWFLSVDSDSFHSSFSAIELSLSLSSSPQSELRHTFPGSDRFTGLPRRSIFIPTAIHRFVREVARDCAIFEFIDLEEFPHIHSVFYSGKTLDITPLSRAEQHQDIRSPEYLRLTLITTLPMVSRHMFFTISLSNERILGFASVGWSQFGFWFPSWALCRFGGPSFAIFKEMVASLFLVNFLFALNRDISTRGRGHRSIDVSFSVTEEIEHHPTDLDTRMLRLAHNSPRSQSILMFPLSEMNGRGLHSFRDRTSKHCSCGDPFQSMSRSSHGLSFILKDRSTTFTALSPPPPTSISGSVHVTTEFETPADHRIYQFAISADLALKMVAKGLFRIHHPISRSISWVLAWTSCSSEFTWHRGMTRSLVFLNRYTSSICRGLTSKDVLVKIQVLVDCSHIDLDRTVLLFKLSCLISAGAYSKHLGRKGHIFSPSLFKKRVLSAISSHWERSLPLSSLLRERIFPPLTLFMRVGFCPVIKPRMLILLLTVMLSFVEVFSRPEDAVGIVSLILIGLVVVSKSHFAENAVTTPQLTYINVVRPEFSLASRISTTSDSRVNILSNFHQFVSLSPLMFSSFDFISASRLAYWVCPIVRFATCNLYA